MVSAHHLSARIDCPLAEAHSRLLTVGGIEVPLATHDGFIWPLPRQHMCDPAAIKVRLAEDIIAIWRANDGHLADGDLIRLGWAVDDNDTRVLAWRLRRLLADASLSFGRCTAGSHRRGLPKPDGPAAEAGGVR